MEFEESVEYEEIINDIPTGKITKDIIIWRMVLNDPKRPCTEVEKDVGNNGGYTYNCYF